MYLKKKKLLCAYMENTLNSKIRTKSFSLFEIPFQTSSVYLSEYSELVTVFWMPL